METNPRQFQWVEKYRPNRIADCILPVALKKQFQSIVDSGTMVNLILSGKAGTGKSTVAKALADEMDRDILFKNASLDRSIDTVRYDVANFSSTMSFSGKPKIVVFDEADNMRPDTQLSLRGFIEEYAVNANFIFTCNQKSKLIQPIRDSRCAIIDFVIPKEEKATLAREMAARSKEILELEKITFDPKDVNSIVLQCFPDFRKTLVELQRLSLTGTLVMEEIASVDDASIKELAAKMIERDMGFVRKWVAANADNDPTRIMTKLYHALYDKIVPANIPDMITTVAKYQHWAVTAVSPEINLMACIVEIVALCEFKK